MKRLLLSTLFTLFAVAAFAQKGTVTGTVVDADTGETVAGAVLEFAPAAAPDKKQYSTSGYKGAVSIPSLAVEYKLVVSFLGYNSAETTFKVSAAKQDIGKIELRPGVQIETVVKEAKALRTSQKGDTVSYNAGAFKVTDDADVEGLLKKMPGITVSDGTVEAQGESVKKIFVDGKEFFGEDVTTAIKSLPAQAVDRIEVYNKLSDAAEFSGMDDGEGYKALNIVTHANMRQGQFGKLYAGYGYDADTKTEAKNKYVIGGNANIFSGDSRVSVIGLFNNINQQNFSFEDILGVSGSGGGRCGGVGQYMVRPQSGVASVNAIGVNYSDTWGKRDQVSFQGSYFFNNTDTKNQSTVDKWYESPMPVDTLATRGYSNTEAYNHRFNARLEWKISDNQNLMVRPSFSYQSNDPLSTTQGWQFGQSGYSRTENFNDGLRHGYNERRLPCQAREGRPYDHPRRQCELFGQYQQLEFLLERPADFVRTSRRCRRPVGLGHDGLYPAALPAQPCPLEQLRPARAVHLYGARGQICPGERAVPYPLRLSGARQEVVHNRAGLFGRRASPRRGAF